jgi:hypothetical protein
MVGMDKDAGVFGSEYVDPAGGRVAGIIAIGGGLIPSCDLSSVDVELLSDDTVVECDHVV